MDTLSVPTLTPSSPPRSSSEAGFSYVDVMIAITILLIGVLGLAGVLSLTSIRSKESEQQLLAKELAEAAMESVYSARDIKTLSWSSIGNVGSNINATTGVAQGVFLTGFQPIRPEAGTDGIVGTADDSGTTKLGGYTRQIAITDICNPARPSYNCSPAGPWSVNLRRVDVIVRYPATNNTQREERLSSVISNYILENN